MRGREAASCRQQPERASFPDDADDLEEGRAWGGGTGGARSKVKVQPPLRSIAAFPGLGRILTARGPRAWAASTPCGREAETAMADLGDVPSPRGTRGH